MKMTTLKSVAIAVGLASSAFGQATSPVVGYISLGNAGVVAPSTEVTLSVPFEGKAQQTVTVGSASGLTITVTNVLTAGAYAPGVDGVPFVLTTSGGDQLLIATNSSSDFTIVEDPSGAVANIAAGDQLRVLTSITLGSFLSGATIPDNTEFSVFGVQTGVNNSPSVNYINFGGSWFDGLSGAPADNAVLFPGESYLLRNISATESITGLVTAGSVPVSDSSILVSKDGAGAQDTRISYFSPIDEIIGVSGLASIAEDNDTLLVYDNTATGLNKSSSVNLVFFSGSWFDGTSGADVTNTFALKGGEGYVLRKEATSASGNFVLSDGQTYRPNL